MSNTDAERVQMTESAGEQQQPHSQMTLDELVACTVRSLQMDNQFKVKTDELANLIPEFAGREEDDVINFFQRIEAVKRVYKPNEDCLLLVVISKLSGSAKKWFNSKPEYIDLDLDQLQVEMKKVYGSREDKLTLRRRFEMRKWKKGEKFMDYYQHKVILENKIGLSEDELVAYIIDGFDNVTLQNQARMARLTALDDLQSVMKEVRNSSYDKNISVKKSSSESDSKTTDEKSTTSIRCFNCNETGHIISTCPKPKRERGSCYICGAREHQRKNCPQVKSSGTSHSATRASNNTSQTSSTANNATLVLEQMPAPAWTIPTLLRFNEYEFCLNSILDSGSPISLLNIRMLEGKDCQLKMIGNEFNYAGINGSRLQALGKSG